MRFGFLALGLMLAACGQGPAPPPNPDALPPPANLEKLPPPR